MLPVRIIFKIVFVLLILRSVPICAQTDTSSRKIAIKINPTILFEYALGVEYFLNQKTSIESSFGVNSLSDFLHRPQQAYTFRCAAKFYFKSKRGIYYFSPAFFYRYKSYGERSYYSGYKTDNIFETEAAIPFDSEEKPGPIGKENVHVFCLEGFFGKELFIGRSKRFIVDYYIGAGLRIKYRMLNITYISVPIKKNGPFGDTTYEYITPPDGQKQENFFSGIIPTIQPGFKLGYKF